MTTQTVAYATLLKNRLTPVPPILVSLDPGDHIGYAVFQSGKLNKVGEQHGNTHFHNIKWLIDFLPTVPAGTPVICEDYRIYKNKLEAHTYSQVDTIRLIGAIETLCMQNNLKLHLQMASEGKAFFDDKRLEQLWRQLLSNSHSSIRLPSPAHSLPIPPKSPHARDAVRHGLHYLVFNR